MLTNTSTPYAPWTVVPANDMNYKTYLVFKTIIDRLEDALDVERTEWKDLATLEAEAEKKAQAKKKKKQAKKTKVEDAGRGDDSPHAEQIIEQVDGAPLCGVAVAVEEIVTEEIVTDEFDTVENQPEELLTEGIRAKISRRRIREGKIEEATHNA